MSVRVVALTTINPTQPEAIETYIQTTASLLVAAGAEFVSRYEVTDQIVGEAGTQYITVLDYPSRAAMDSVFESETYKALRPTRDRAFSQYEIHVVKTL